MQRLRHRVSAQIFFLTGSKVLVILKRNVSEAEFCGTASHSLGGMMADA